LHRVLPIDSLDRVDAVFQKREGCQVNLPVAVWLIIVPMLLKIDPAVLNEVGQHWRGAATTVGVAGLDVCCHLFGSL
jgi:hypothetical protein